MAQAVSQWRAVLAIPRGGRHCCGALLCAIFQRNPLGRDSQPLHDVGARRSITPEYHEPGRSGRRVARAGGGTCVTSSPCATQLVVRFVPLGRRDERSAPARGQAGDRAPAHGPRISLRSNGGGTGPPPTQADNTGQVAGGVSLEPKSFLSVLGAATGTRPSGLLPARLLLRRPSATVQRFDE